MLERFSDLHKLKRIIALMHRFIYNCKSRANERKVGPLLKSELENSFMLLIKHVQSHLRQKSNKLNVKI